MSTTMRNPTSVSGKTSTPHTSFVREFINTIKGGDHHHHNNTSKSSSVTALSPTRISRLQEKEELQNLNDRLVIYIETVRRLESENSRLQTLVTSYNETQTNNVSEIKNMYERELDEAKRLIDELAKDKAKLEIDLNKYRIGAEEANSKLAKVQRDYKTLEQHLKSSEREAQEYKSRMETALHDLTRLRDETCNLRPQINDLEKQLSNIKKQLEDETLQRVDLENKNQTLKEDLQFKQQIYDKEVEQMRSSKRIEIEQVDVKLREDYDNRLVSELQRIRDEAERKIQEMKDDVHKRYQSQLAEHEANKHRAAQSSATLHEELNSMRGRNTELHNDLLHASSRISTLESKIRDLEEKLSKAASKYENDMTAKDNEISGLRKEIQELMLEYQELYDTKIALDMEIQAYRKLLESEEQRLNIAYTSTQAANQSKIDKLDGSFLSSTAMNSSTKGRKRRAQEPAVNDDSSILASSAVNLDQSHRTTSGVEISEHDLEGKCVRLGNSTSKDIQIGAWQIKRDCNNGESIDYRFNKNVLLKPNQSVSVWSQGTPGAQHDPPSSFIMQGKWPVADSMITVLLDKEGNEQARRESMRTTSNDSKKIKSSPNNGNSSITKLFGLWK